MWGLNCGPYMREPSITVAPFELVIFQHNMSLILTNSTAIHGKIKEMFSTKTRHRRRVVLVAYVGKDAPSLLPDAQGVEIYCWPQAGATHPEAIRTLVQRGAEIFFVPSLHMKLYWVRDIGALFTSANLSRNALGVGGLHEAGVFLEDLKGLDIDHLIHGLSAQMLTDDLLDALQRDHDNFSERLHLPTSSTKSPSLLEWFE